MKLIGIPQDFDSACLYVKEYFHKVALGLESGTEVYLSALPPETPVRGVMNEVLVTTFKPDQWPKLWRLSLELKEGEGVVASVLDYLRNNLNISILETLTTESGRSHELLAIVENVNSLAEDTLAKMLTEGIQDKLGNVLLSGTQPTLYRMSRLHAAAERRAQCSPPLRDWVTATVENGRIKLPDGEVRRLLGSTAEDEIEMPKKVMMFSDTEEKYLLVYFPKNTDCLLRASIKHQELQGALHTFADRLKQMRVNILSSYLRLQRSGQRAQWKVTMDVTRAKSCKDILAGVRGCKPFFIDIDALSLHYVPGTRRRTREVASNPYKFTESVDSDEMLFGRQKEITVVVTSSVLASGQMQTNYQINGYYRAGKTALLKALRRRLEREVNPRLVPVYLDLKDARPDTFRQMVLRAVCLAVLKQEGQPDWERVIERYLITGELPADTPESIRIEVGRLSPSGTGSVWNPRQTGLDQSLDRLLGYAEKNGVKGIVVLLDEAQDMLHRHGAFADSGIASDEFHKLVSRGGAIRWIVADAFHWRGAKASDTGLTSRMTSLTMSALAEDDAKMMVTAPFSANNIEVDHHAVARCIKLTGRQPCYLQALCQYIYDSIALAPDVVDVVTKGMVEHVLDDVLDALQAQFATMYTDLATVVREKALKMLLGGKSLRVSELVQPDILKKSSLTLAAVPGLVVSGGSRQPQQIEAVELFCRWAVRNGHVKLFKRRRNQHGE